MIFTCKQVIGLNEAFTNQLDKFEDSRQRPEVVDVELEPAQGMFSFGWFVGLLVVDSYHRLRRHHAG